MKVDFTFRNIKPSQRLRKYAGDKIEKLQKYLRSPLEAEVTFYTEGHSDWVEMSVHADGSRYAAKAESAEMRASIDLCIDKVDRQVRANKQAATDRMRHSGGVSQLSGKRGPTPELES